MAAAPGRRIPQGRGDLGRVGGGWMTPPFPHPTPSWLHAGVGGLHPTRPPFPRPTSLGGTRPHPSPHPHPRGGEMLRPPRIHPGFHPGFPSPPPPCGCRSGAGRGEGGGGGGDAGRGKCWGALAQPLETPPRLLPGLLGPCGLGSPGPPWIYPGHAPPFPLSQVRSEHQNLWGVPFCPERWGDWGSPPGFGVQPHPVFWGALGWGPFAAASPKRSVTVTGRGWEGPFGVRGPGGRLGPPPRAAAARRRPPR